MLNLSRRHLPKSARASRLAAMTQAAAQHWLRAQQQASRTRDEGRRTPPTIEGTVAARPSPDLHAPDWLRFVPENVRGLVASHLPPAIRTLGGELTPGFPLPQVDAFPHAAAKTELPDGAQFLSGSFSNDAGTRPYKLYVPSGYKGEPVPVVVMLHGCTQSPDDFAAGTRMNAAAEEQTWLVVYPGQTAAAHPQKCWKWFSAQDQQRDAGEPSLIAGITRQVMRDYAVDPARVYVAGMSAGGAAAAIMAETYPDLYAAVGVHSGLACGSAHDLPSALAAMQGAGGRAASGRPRAIVPAIVFHGDRDRTVSPRNGDDVVERATLAASSRSRVVKGDAPGGRSYTCTVHLDEAGRPLTEHWVIEGAGHAWSGGSAAGSYTDPQGPDATREMLRFFQEHPRG
jgi:poly(hydroxyalkanoate) depolymerase family esterase